MDYGGEEVRDGVACAGGWEEHENAWRVSMTVRDVWTSYASDIRAVDLPVGEYDPQSFSVESLYAILVCISGLRPLQNFELRGRQETSSLWPVE